MLTKEQIIAILASEHSVIASKDDPVITFLIVHQLILDQYKKEFNTLFENKFNELSVEIENSKDELNKTLYEYKETCKNLTNEMVGSATLSITKETLELIKAIKDSKQQDLSNKTTLSLQIYLVMGIALFLLAVDILKLFI